MDSKNRRSTERASGVSAQGVRIRVVKVFISSVVSGFEGQREAAAQAAGALGHEVRRSEDFPASIQTPQQACLAGVRWSDVVILLLGARYGKPQDSGLSATHEEYEEAKPNKRLLTFVEEGVEREPAQDAFVSEVQGWSGGTLTKSFAAPEELRIVVTRSLHDLELSMQAGSVDEQEMADRAQALVPDRVDHLSGRLVLAAAFGPRQPILSPKALEDSELDRDLHREALLGEHAILDKRDGVDTRIEGSALVLEQRNASILVDQTGDMRLTFPAIEHEDRAALPALIEEDVNGRIVRVLRLAAWIADRIDPTSKLTSVAPVVAVLGSSYLGWRTRDEQARHPNEMTMSMRAADRAIIALSPPVRPRQALAYDTAQMADDFVVLLRRLDK